MDTFEQQVAHYIHQHRLLELDDHVIVALSGGADSVALLSALVSLGYHCIAAHCNFHLRGEESERDQQHAESTARHLGVECMVTHFDTEAYAKRNGVSIEMAARDLRYQWFEQIRVERQASAIAVAHHNDDNAETFFLNLLRGTGITGLTGMAPRREHIVRPLLGVSHIQILAYLDNIGLSYVTDSSNASNDYKRNRLRNVILPLLEEHFPGAKDAILRTMGNLTEDKSLMDDILRQAKAKYLDNETIDLMRLSADSPNPRSLLYHIVKQWGFNASQAASMIECRQSPGAQFRSADYQAIVHDGKLEIASTDSLSNPEKEYPIDLSEDIKAPISLRINYFTYSESFKLKLSNNTIYLDASVMDGKPSFVIRRWRKGDRIAPFGMKGTRLVSDLFSDAHLSLFDKQNVWLLTRNNVILWVIGMRASRHYPLNANSTEAISLTVG